MIPLLLKDAKGNSTSFTEKVMFHVGSDYVDFSQKYHMVAFNLDLMDAVWTEDDGKTSMLAKWDNIFNYFADGFTVCKASSGISELYYLRVLPIQTIYQGQFLIWKPTASIKCWTLSRD